MNPQPEVKMARAKSDITKKEIEKEMRAACAAAVKKLGPKTSAEIEAYRKTGVCAICERRPRKGLLCRDHHHRSGNFRGLLCVPCNLALGLIKDEPETAEAMAKYLLKEPVLG